MTAGEPAGVGSRFLALAVDLAIQLTVIGAVLLAADAIFGLRVHPQNLIGFGRTAGASGIGVVALVLIAASCGYFAVFESVWQGRTPGKRVLGLRVVGDAGAPVGAGAAAIRNLVRAAEIVLGAYAVSALVVLRSREQRRLGDYAAGTHVVREHSAPDALDDPSLGAADRGDGLERDDRHLIARFLARRAAFEPPAQRRIAARIAARVRPKLRASFAHLDDEALLEHLGRPA